MSLTTAIITRFWRTMGERYGQRWLQDMGDKPTKSWVDLLNRYTPNQISKAIGLLATESPLHPPTNPQFEKLLERTRRQSGEGVDYVRGFWRSALMRELEDELLYRKLITERRQAEQYLSERKHSLGERLRDLLNRLCEAEGANGGQRTEGLHNTARDSVRALVSA